MTLRAKLILFFFALAVAPMTTVAVVSYINSIRSVEQVVEDSTTSVLQELSVEIEPVFPVSKSEIRLLAKNRPIRELVSHYRNKSKDVDDIHLVAVADFLKQFFKGSRAIYNGVSYYDAAGQEIFRFGRQSGTQEIAQTQVLSEDFVDQSPSQMIGTNYRVTQSGLPLSAKELEQVRQNKNLNVSNRLLSKELDIGTGFQLTFCYPMILPNETEPIGFAITDIDINALLEQTGHSGFVPVEQDESGQLVIITSQSTKQILFKSQLDQQGAFLTQAFPELAAALSENPNVESGFHPFSHDGAKRFASFQHFGNLDWTLFVISRPAEVLAKSEQASTINLVVTLGATGLMLILIPFVAGGVTSSIRKVTAGAEAIADGNLEHEIEVSTRDETRQLADSFNRMARSLRNTVGELQDLTQELENRVEERTKTLEKTHQELEIAQKQIIDDLDQELQTAQNLQMGLMPKEPPQIDGLDIVGSCKSATHVGGDLFQYYPKNDKVTVVMADVTGHAMEAAIPVVMFDGILDSQIEFTDSLEDLFRRLNERMAKRLSKRTYVCCAMAQIDIKSRNLRFANAGCPYPFHYHAATKTISELQVDAFPLGARIESTYSAIDTAMKEGDRLVFCSDGIIEAMNEDGELFGFENTSETILQGGQQQLSVEDLMHHLLNTVATFSGDRAQDDDQTVIVVGATS